MKRALEIACVAWLLGAAPILCAAESPGERWTTTTPAEAGHDAEKLHRARDYALTGGGSGFIVRGGRLVLSWGDTARRYDLKSSTKSFGAAALGLAIKDGKLRLEDRARQHHPTLGTPPESSAQAGWRDAITILQLAAQTAGFDKRGGYAPLLFQPGTAWAYSDAGPNWLAECITLAYRRDVEALMFERIFTPIGIGRSDLVWRKNQYRPALLDGLERNRCESRGSARSGDALVAGRSRGALAARPSREARAPRALPAARRRRFDDAPRHPQRSIAPSGCVLGGGGKGRCADWV